MNPAEGPEQGPVLGSVPEPGQQGLGVALVQGHPGDAVVVRVEVVQGETVISQKPGCIGVAQVAVVVGEIEDRLRVGAGHGMPW